MDILLSLTVLGSIGTLLLIRFKTTLIRRYGGSWYYYIWILVLISFCVPYKLDIFQYIKHLMNNTGQVVDAYPMMNVENLINATGLPDNGFVQQGARVAKQAFHGVSTGEVLCAVYLIGVLVFALYYCFSYLHFSKKIKATTRIVTNEAYQKCLQEACFDMKIARCILLKESALIGSPIFTGIIKPTIILPEGEFAPADLTLILQHELTHYKRRDMVYKFFSLLVHIIHWFNPISYLAIRNINEACEYSCDESLTRGMDKESKRRYGYVLLNQIQSSNKNYLFSMHLIGQNKNKNILERRLKVIMNNKKYKYFHITVCAVLSLVVCSNFFALQSVRAEVQILKDTLTKDIIVEGNTQNGNSVTDGAEAVSQYFAETVTQEALRGIYDFVDKSENSIDAGTRKLTEAEENRMTILREGYVYGGLRPEKALPLVAGDSDFYLDMRNDFYHYPARELTDEELLQLIEWRLKINYALSLRYPQAEAAIPNANEMKEAEAMTLATEYIEKLFDVSRADFRIDATFNQGSTIQPDGWFVRLSSDKLNGNDAGDWNYAVWMSAAEGVRISRSSPTHQSTTMSDVDITTSSKDNSWIEKAKAIVGEVEGEVGRVKEAYFVNIAEDNAEKRTVDVKVDMEDGASYIVSLFYPDQTVKEVSYRNQSF